MKLVINGDEKEFPQGTSIVSLLDRLGLSPDKVAVELNRRLIRAAQYSNVLKSGDQIEIVTFVGGG